MRKAIVITGPQKWKNLHTAKRIARKLGSYTTLREGHMDSPFALGRVLDSKTDSIIFEGLQGYSRTDVLNMVKGEEIEVNRLGEWPKKYTGKHNIIICKMGKDLNIEENDRRFAILYL